MSERAPGFETFIPSRLEWLAFALNSLTPYLDASVDEKISRVYMPNRDGKTLMLIVNYPKDIDAKILEEHIENMKGHAEKFATAKKWDSWVEIEVQHNPE